MPTFLPRIPVTLAISFSVPSLARHDAKAIGWDYSAGVPPAFERASRPLTTALFMLFPECLNLHIHARRQIELHQCIDRLLRRLQDIQQSLVGADFKLLPRFLIHVRRPQHAVLVLHRGQRNRTRDLRAGAFCRLHDLARRLIQNAVVVGFQPNANSFFSSHCFSLFHPSRLIREERSGGNLQAANLVACSVATGLCPVPAGQSPDTTLPTSQSPRSCPRPPYGRLRGSRTAIPFPSPPP